MKPSSPPILFEIGTFLCPTHGSEVLLELSTPLPSLEWPVLVERCPDCGERHVLQYADVQHAPCLGYE